MYIISRAQTTKSYVMHPAISTGITKPHTVFLHDPAGKYHISLSNRTKINNISNMFGGKNLDTVHYFLFYYMRNRRVCISANTKKRF